MFKLNVAQGVARCERRRRGYMLIFSYLVTTMLTVWTFAAFERSVTELRTAQQFQINNQSFQLAESAIDSTLLNLRTGRFVGVPMTTTSTGSYTSTVTQLPRVLEFRIDGQGASGVKQSDLDVVTRLVPASVFQFAIFGYQQADMQGDASVDSYDSSQAPYDPTQPGQDGDVGTNSTSIGGVTLSGSLMIRGQVVVGPSADPNSVVIETGNDVTILGKPPLTSQSVALPMPSESVPIGMTCGDLSLTGRRTVTLNPGTYCYHNLSMSGGSTLTGSGAVKIYITGSLTLTGNIDAGISPQIGETSGTTNMTIVLTNNGQAPTASLTGNSTLHAAVYAPQSTVSISGSSEVFGSVVAQRVQLSGDAQVHYDQSLGSLSAPIGLYQTQILSWHQSD